MLELNVNIKNNETSYPIIIKNDDISNIKSIIENKIGTNKYIVIFSRSIKKINSPRLYNRNRWRCCRRYCRICSFDLYERDKIYTNSNNPACLC